MVRNFLSPGQPICQYQIFLKEDTMILTGISMHCCKNRADNIFFNL